ncbi:Vitamin B12 transporter btuB AltName: Full=Cobalamin receptor; AltName: Full=Outer membrane cobalamin translocator; Flags: Precursor [Bacteroides ovatus V975]|nr:Vitamin B12 transporter btuB AltName: Full=Cobalamin receptor; AltName: Full=Outer membrane cobalamin translocator; Flags: Precursor [Bacteroides ovatus V975]
MCRLNSDLNKRIFYTYKIKDMLSIQVHSYNKHCIHLRWILCLILSLFTTVPAISQSRVRHQTSLSDTLLKLKEVTIYSNRMQKKMSPVQILSGKELEKLNVYSVADALRYFSGVQIKDYGGIGGLKTVNIRSMGSHHVGVFYDGIELGNAQNGVVDLGRFSLDNMEVISLYNGQKSAIFQPAKDYSSASAIYMQTRKPLFKGEKKNNLNIGVKGGSFSTINPSLLWEHRFNERISSSISTEYMYTSGRYKFTYAKKDGYDTTAVRQNGDVRMLRLENAFFGKIPKGEWKAKAYLYNSERGYPGAAVREEPGKFRHQDRQWDTNLFVQGSFQNYFKPWYSLLANGKYAYDYLHYLSDPRLDVTTMYVDNYYRQQEIYASAAHLFTIYPWWSMSLSNDFQWNTLRADLIDFVYPTRNTILTSAATSFDFNRLMLQASLLYTHVDDNTRTKGANAGTKNKYTPSVIATWQPLTKLPLNVRAFYKKVFRMPTLNDLYYTFIGNKDLKPEYTTQYDVGITFSHTWNNHWLKSLDLQIDGYYSEVDDKIIAMPTSNQFRWTMINLGHVEIRGLDAAIRGEWGFGKVELSTLFNYTYQKAQDFTDPTSEWYGGQIPYIPWHGGSIILNGSYQTWSCNYSFIYTGERYEAVANIPENYAQPWYTHDFSLSKTFQWGKTGIRVTAEINNIFNQQYEVVQCYPMPGTSFKIKLNVML